MAVDWAFDMLDFDTLQRGFNSARAGFVKAEIDLGLTFSQMAIDTKDSVKRQRCTRLAREACDTAERFLRDISHDDFEQDIHLKPLMVRLQGRLQLLALIP